MQIDTGRVAMIPITSIDIGDRARQEMGDLQDLENSLKSTGLIQPLAVKLLENERYLLLAGERRYTVLLANQVIEVPARIYEGEISALKMKIIEKSENFYRKDFEYYEYDALINEIHTLEQQIKGTSAPGPGHGGHKLKDTAEMFGVTDASVSTAIKRAEARDAFPELFESCKTQKDATNVIKKMSESIIKETIAEKLDRDKQGGSTLTKLANCYVLGDFFEGIKKIPDGVMHLVEIDPPYAVGLQTAKKVEGESIYNLDEYNEVDKDDYPVFLSKVFKECYRVMADHSWMIVWFGMHPWFETVFKEINHAGFNSTRLCGLWLKRTGQSKRPEMHLANSYETFFYAWKGRPALNKAGRTNIFEYSPVPSIQKSHPTERPIELMQELYNTFAFSGSRILIPFLGSGNGLIAAHNLGMSSIGFELSKSYRDSFLVRVNEMK